MKNDETIFSYVHVAQLNKTELYIRDYITEHPKNVFHMSVRELADTMNVSTATLLRFTQKLGCDGFNDFKEKFKAELSGARIPTQEDISNAICQELHRYEEETYQKRINQFVQAIEKADITAVYGIGKSTGLATYAARCLTDTGHGAIAVTDPFYPRLSMNCEHLLFLCLSHSGETKETLIQAAQYHKRGAVIGSITAHAESSLAALSDIYLDYKSTDIYLPNTINLSSDFLMIFLIETIARHLLEKDISALRQSF